MKLTHYVPGYLTHYVPGYLTRYVLDYLTHYVPGYLTHYVPGYLTRYVLNYLTHYVPGYFIKIHKMGPIVIYYHVNTIGREYNWTRMDCPQMGTVGYNGYK